MFLTKKARIKIIITTVVSCILGSLCIGIALFSNLFFDLNVDLYITVGLICIVLGILTAIFTPSAEGKDKLIKSANNLLYRELRPSEFIKQYETLKNSSDLAVKRPDYEVLRCVASSYLALMDKEKCLATVEEMIAVAPEKKRMRTLLFKSAILFSFGEAEEGEKLFAKANESALGLSDRNFSDVILKCERAMAFGEFKTAQAYLTHVASRNSALDTPLLKFSAHLDLARIYEKLGDAENAVLQYRYCVNNGGEMPAKELAVAAIERLQNA